MSFSKLLSFVAFFFTITATTQAQVNIINLGQTPGEFTIKSLTLAPGDYQFEIANNGVGHDVGFVLAPKGKTDAAHHIKEAYVTTPVKNNSTSTSNVVTLTPGKYVYFCPLNPTEQYNLTVATTTQMKKVDKMEKHKKGKGK